MRFSQILDSGGRISTGARRKRNYAPVPPPIHLAFSIRGPRQEIRNFQRAGFPLQNQQNKAKLIDKRGSLGVPFNNALDVKMNREEHSGSLSSNWQISITTFVVSVFLISLTGCTGKPQPVIQHGGLDQCVSNPKFCIAEDLCRLAIFEEDNIRRWNNDNLRWHPYVEEAQSRGLTCGL